MIPHLFFYQLAVLGLLWLCVMLHAAWPSRCMTAQGPSAKPILPRRQRSKEPKPFAGLTHKPHCALCEQERAYPKAPPALRPEPVLPSNRRPREVETSRHFCPYAGCAHARREARRATVDAGRCPVAEITFRACTGRLLRGFDDGRGGD